MKDPTNCPFCEAEEKGYSSGWGFSPEGWLEMEERHSREHQAEDIKVFDTPEELITDLNEPALNDVNHWAKWVVMQRLARMIVKDAAEPEPVDWEKPRLE